MKPLANPATELFCSNSDCGFKDEGWRFAAFGGDDVEYKCPRCDAVAGLTPPKSTPDVVPEELSEGVAMQQTKETESTVSKNIFRPDLLCIVVNFGQSIEIRTSEEVFIANEVDGDLIIPMFEPDQLSSLSPNALAKFRKDLEQLVAALDAGDCPEHPEVEAWLASYYKPSANAFEDIEDVDKFAEGSEVVGLGFADGFVEGFRAGFLACFERDLHRERLLATGSLNERPSPEIDGPFESKEAPEVEKPRTPHVAPRKKKALLSALRRVKRRGSK